MKKVIIGLVVLVLLLIGGGTALVMYLLSETPAEDSASEEITADAEDEEDEEEDTSADPAAPPKIKVNRPFKSQADLMEALAKATKKNPDTVGWLTIPNTDINDSVVQSNNNAYYLRKTELGKDSIYGCYFADYTCNLGSRDLLSPNTIIYGHSDLTDNPDGPKFSQLFKFTDEAFARANPGMTFALPDDNMQWEIFAVFFTSTDMMYNHSDLSTAELQQVVSEAKAKSLYNYDVPVNAEDKVLSLSTCSVKYGATKEQRFVVMAKLLPFDQTLPAAASLTVNPNPVQDFE